MNRYAMPLAALAVIHLSGIAKADDVAPNPVAAVYSVKFLCGFQRPPTGSAAAIAIPANEPVVKPGNYATSVNIHNYHQFPVTFCKKAVLAPTERCLEGQAENCLKPVIGKPVRFTLKSNQAMAIDCRDIVDLLGASVPSFIEGFVEISVPSQSGLQKPTNPLSITGVYTSLGCTLVPGATGCRNLNGSGLDVDPQNSFAGEASPECKQF